MMAEQGPQRLSGWTSKGFGAAARCAASRAVGRPRRVLVVDDYPLFRMVVTNILRAAGHVVAEAEGGREAIDRLSTSPVDLVLTDLRMPDLSGWDVAKATRALRPKVPVVLMTGCLDGLESEPEAGRLVKHILLKPFLAEELLELITMLAGEGETDGESEVDAPAEAPRGVAAAAPAPSAP